MTFRFVGIDLVLAPLIFGALPIATVWTMDQLGVPVAIVLGGLVSLLLTLIFNRVEYTDAGWWRTHLRHSLLVYPWFLFAALMLQEGLTASLSKPFAIMTAVLIATNALPTWLLRHRDHAV